MTETSVSLRTEFGDSRRALALAVPVLVPVAMAGAFVLCRERLGDQPGYLAGFGVYWGTCAALSLAILGRRGVRRLWRPGCSRLGHPATMGAALLLWPPAGAIATRFLPELGDATPTMLVTIAGVALTNALLEELLWRGVFITLWPANAWLGWIWPALGFGAWHFAPQVIHPSSMGALPYFAATLALGLSWGWVAWRSGSLRWVSLSHVLTDGSGVRNALFFLGA